MIVMHNLHTAAGADLFFDGFSVKLEIKILKNLNKKGMRFYRRSDITWEFKNVILLLKLYESYFFIFRLHSNCILFARFKIFYRILTLKFYFLRSSSKCYHSTTFFSKRYAFIYTQFNVLYQPYSSN